MIEFNVAALRFENLAEYFVIFACLAGKSFKLLFVHFVILFKLIFGIILTRAQPANQLTLCQRSWFFVAAAEIHLVTKKGNERLKYGFKF